MKPSDKAVRAESIRRFDRWADDYRRWYAQPHGPDPRSAFAYARVYLDEAWSAVVADLAVPSQVLDVGCGTGDYLRRLRERGHDPVGVEPSSKMRDIARRANPVTPILPAVISDLPFQDARFDLVMAIEVMRYLAPEDARAALREMVRVTKPGGRLFVTLLNRHALNTFRLYCALRSAWHTLTGRVGMVHAEFSSISQIRRELTALSMREIEIVPWVVLPVVRPAYRVHPAAGAWTARLTGPLERRLRRRVWAAQIAGGLIVVARR